jgi:deoxyribodipyrimidine photo-lyase
VSEAPTIAWLRNDLRLRDHAALSGAAAAGPVVPVFIWDPQVEGDWPPGAASRWWLHHSLAALDASLRERGSRLTLRIGPAERELAALAAESGATGVTWQRRYEPDSIARDTRLKASLRERGLGATSHAGALLIEPWALENQSGRPFQVFTPFWRAAVARIGEVEPLPAPATLAAPRRWPRSATLAELDLLPRIRWDAGLTSEWTPGEAGAQARLERFIDEAFDAYADARDRPAVPGTSRLSPHLHIGELTPRQAWRAVRARCERHGGTKGEWRSSKFLAEIGWREFAHHLLYHFPRLPTEPLRPEFARFPWREDAAALEAWRRGRTGIPLVDAGMRELWTTGYMHNRVRMVVASLLVKNLRIHWLEGARWFWDTLVDADLANNTQGWQWTAGCGADAAPFFRVFNPVSQGLRFDPDGAYIRRWVPELRALPAPAVHAPWEADEAELHAAGVALGRDYPRPIVDLKASRAAALDAFKGMRDA